VTVAFTLGLSQLVGIDLQQVSIAALIIALGLLFLLAPVFPRLAREWRPEGLILRAGGGPIIAGAAFAVAWTPCIGPTLGAILTAAATTGSAGQGGVLLAFYSLGLAVPFLLTAVAFDRATTAFRWLRNHYVVITAVSGAVLVAMGLLMVTGELTWLKGKQTACGGKCDDPAKIDRAVEAVEKAVTEGPAKKG